jgi:hypothetical protein
VETVELLELAMDADCWPRTICDEILAAAIESRALLLGLIKKYT